MYWTGNGGQEVIAQVDDIVEAEDRADAEVLGEM